MAEKVEHARTVLKNYAAKQLHFIFKDYNNVYSADESLFSQSNLEKANQLFFQFLQDHTVDSLMSFYAEFTGRYGARFVDGQKVIEEHLQRGENVVFEGAQGALLDRIHGIFPHITKTLCSDHNAFALINALKAKPRVVKIGVFRIFSSRHGNGPFLTNSEQWKKYLPECHNSSTSWQGNFRIGPFDLVAAKYGIEIFKPDYLSITCIDKLADAVRQNLVSLQLCDSYRLEKPSDTQLELLQQHSAHIKHRPEPDKSVVITQISRQDPERAYKSTDLLNVLQNAAPQYKNVPEDKDSAPQTVNPSFQSVIKEFRKKQLSQISDQQSDQLFGYVSFIEQQLAVPMLVLSCGPTWQDKRHVEKFSLL